MKTNSASRFTIKAASYEVKPGCWNYNKVEIFDGDVKIGEYERNYPSMLRTWWPFKQDGKDYALYSDHYVATSVMSLPDCKNIVTEPLVSHGFCPADFFVPEGINGQFGFVAGCVWGDDTSWKIEFLDLSKISEGILKREHKFGYIELLPRKDLNNSIRVYEKHLPGRRLINMKFSPGHMDLGKYVEDDEHKDLVVYPDLPEYRPDVEISCPVIIDKIFDVDKDYSDIDWGEYVAQRCPLLKDAIAEY